MKIKMYKCISIFLKKKKADRMFEKCKKMRRKMDKAQKKLNHLNSHFCKIKSETENLYKQLDEIYNKEYVSLKDDSYMLRAL